LFIVIAGVHQRFGSKLHALRAQVTSYKVYKVIKFYKTETL